MQKMGYQDLPENAPDLALEALGKIEREAEYYW
jgi:hypothetical protein